MPTDLALAGVAFVALCLYFLTARLFGRAAGVAAAATELLLSICLAAEAPYAHAPGLKIVVPSTPNSRRHASVPESRRSRVSAAGPRVRR